MKCLMVKDKMLKKKNLSKEKWQGYAGKIKNHETALKKMFWMSNSCFKERKGYYTTKQSSICQYPCFKNKTKNNDRSLNLPVS